MAKGENSPCFQFIHKTLGTGIVGVEIGIWDGGNAEAVLNYIYPKRYYMIDPYSVYPGNDWVTQPMYDAKYQEVVNKFSIYNSSIMMRMTSEKASKIVENELDFVYIDGAHDLVNKMLDLTLWYPKVRSGGIICGDDYNIPDVAKAVTIFSEKTGINFSISSDSDPHPPEFWAIKE
jgi:hypothetical protein